MKQLNTVDAETLMNMPLIPIHFVIDTFLPQGLHVFAGASKIGKSWLSLWLCLQIAKGENVWNFKTEQGTVLYFCLEDNLPRIQNRLVDITDDAPSNLHFATLSDSIGCGLEEQITKFAQNYSDTKLVVIDTLQKIRVAANDNAYANDYHDLSILKSLADQLGISILLVHHTRKMHDDDPMNMVLGSSGITGTVDSSFVLKKDKRSSNEATLYCEGRDIEYRELKLRFLKETCLWELLSDSVEEPQKLLENVISLVCNHIKSTGEFIGTPTELAEILQSMTEEKISPSGLSKKLIKNQFELLNSGIRHVARRSNSKRIIELSYIGDGSVGNDGKNCISPYGQNAVSTVADVAE